MKKKVLIFVLMVVMVFNTFTVQAQNNKNYKNGNNKHFTDVDEDYWAFEFIELMNKYGIIMGYGDNSFRPNEKVTREEFAKMMVLTLGLDLENPSKGTFEDVNKGDWAYKYVETAKMYLTGYDTSQGLYFKPKYDAQREDMAVAIVKALEIDLDDVDLSVLDNLKDEDDISKNLRKYVAGAIEEGIMVGDNNKKFKPTATLTRAEAATILARLIIGEKIVFDETKVVVDDTDTSDDQSQTPELSGKINNDQIVLNWTEVDSDDFKYYKVVLSKGDSTPSYPNDGYAKVISNVKTTSCQLEEGDTYYNGDFGGEIDEGQAYYISITAVYDNKNFTSNVIRLTIPEDDEDADQYRTPKLSYGEVGDGIKLLWTETDEEDFVYYKVVVSKSDSTPSYPNDGYITYISDNETTTYTLKDGMDYVDGDFEELESGEKYYVAITAVYDNEKLTSNVIRVTLP